MLCRPLFGLGVITLYSFLRIHTCQLRTLVPFFLGWNRWGKHWQLSLLSASVYDPLAERGRVQCHHCGSEKVTDATLTRNMFSCRNGEPSMREGKSLPVAPSSLLLMPWPDPWLHERLQKPASHLALSTLLPRLAKFNW